MIERQRGPAAVDPTDSCKRAVVGQDRGQQERGPSHRAPGPRAQHDRERCRLATRAHDRCAPAQQEDVLDDRHRTGARRDAEHRSQGSGEHQDPDGYGVRDMQLGPRRARPEQDGQQSHRHEEILGSYVPGTLRSQQRKERYAHGHHDDRQTIAARDRRETPVPGFHMISMRLVHASVVELRYLVRRLVGVRKTDSRSALRVELRLSAVGEVVDDAPRAVTSGVQALRSTVVRHAEIRRRATGTG